MYALFSLPTSYMILSNYPIHFKAFLPPLLADHSQTKYSQFEVHMQHVLMERWLIGVSEREIKYFLQYFPTLHVSLLLL